jgi:prepilin-type N-terminal cleavage/methylation domain-containing protein
MQQGFTLLELLVVIALIAVTAFIVTGTFRGVSEDANDRLVRVEMQEIAKAIEQFKQDTGYYPKTGPFDLSNYGGAIPYGNLPGYAGGSNSKRDLWFYSPANFYQILSRTSPLVGTGHQLETWDPETNRGWRGPYLKGYAEGYLDIRSGINDETSAGNPSGDPLAGNNITDVEGIADPFEHRAENVSGNTLLDWSATAGGTEREKWGRPYLVFDLDEDPWIVSMGPNGQYDSIDRIPSEDDIVLDID